MKQTLTPKPKSAAAQPSPELEKADSGTDKTH